MGKTPLDITVKYTGAPAHRCLRGVCESDGVKNPKQNKGLVIEIFNEQKKNQEGVCVGILEGGFKILNSGENKYTQLIKINNCLNKYFADESQFKENIGITDRITMLDRNSLILIDENDPILEPYKYLLEKKSRKNIENQKVFSDKIYDGGLKQIISEYKYRNPELKKKRIEYVGTYKCEICDFEFKSMYGELGEGVIDYHHLYPEKLKTKSETDIDDVILICSNCHRIIHKSVDTPIPPSELKEIIESNKKRSEL